MGIHNNPRANYYIPCFHEFKISEKHKISIDLTSIERYSELNDDVNQKMTSFVYKSGHKETLAIPYDDVKKAMKLLTPTISF